MSNIGKYPLFPAYAVNMNPKMEIDVLIEQTLIGHALEETREWICQTTFLIMPIKDVFTHTDPDIYRPNVIHPISEALSHG